MHTGTPAASARWVVPIPPYVTTRSTSGITLAWGRKRTMRVRSWGATNLLGSSTAVVTTTLPGSSASASSAVAMIAPSSWSSVDTLTSTRGRVRLGYSNGSAVR